MLFLHQLTEQVPDLLRRVGTTVKIANPPYMTLTVESIGPGLRGMPALSVCHYGEQNGDLMRDPEMCFEMELEGGRLKALHPYYFRNDYAGAEQFARDEETGRVHTQLIQAQREFAELWSRNLFEQGFLEAFIVQNVSILDR